jgi:hypothetical protein
MPRPQVRGHRGGWQTDDFAGSSASAKLNS